MARRFQFGFDLRIPAGLVMAAIGFVLTILGYPAHGGLEHPAFLAGVDHRLGPDADRGWGRRAASNLGLYALPSREAVRYWPLTVMLVGLVEIVLFRKIGSSGRTLGRFRFGPCRPWPLALAASGAVMVWRGLR